MGKVLTLRLRYFELEVGRVTKGHIWQCYCLFVLMSYDASFCIGLEVEPWYRIPPLESNCLELRQNSKRCQWPNLKKIRFKLAKRFMKYCMFKDYCKRYATLDRQFSSRIRQILTKVKRTWASLLLLSPGSQHHMISKTRPCQISKSDLCSCWDVSPKRMAF